MALRTFKRAYVEITDRCNLCCDFCPGTARPARDMTVAEFAAVADALRPCTGYLYLHVMGEALLHPELPAILSAAGERGFRVCLTTNGTLLPEKGGAVLESPAVHKVSVSLHSFEGNGGTDPAAYLSGVWAFAEEAAARGKKCALRLWNAGTDERLNSEVENFLSEKCGVDVSALPRDRGGNRRLGENLFLEHAPRFDWPSPDAPERNVTFCHGLRQQVAVLCDGTVVPCCLDGQGVMALGNLFTQPLDEILSSPRAQAIYEGFSRRQAAEPLCRRCGYATRFTR